MEIKAVIFDLDGTTADTIPLTLHAVREVAKELTGKEYSDEEILKRFGPPDTKLVEELIGEDKREISVDTYIRYFDKSFHDFVKPIDGMDDLLKYLKAKGIKIGLFTGRSLVATKVVLKKLDIESYFDYILAGDSTENPKPDPEGILKVLDIFGLEPKDAIYVGDFDVDIKASKAAGTMSVLALWSSTGSEKLIDQEPDKYFRSPYEFIQWMKVI